METRISSARHVGKTFRMLSVLKSCWRAGHQTIMYSGKYSSVNPFLTQEYMEYIEEMKRFGPNEYRRLLEGSWDDK